MTELNNLFLIWGKEPECVFKWVVRKLSTEELMLLNGGVGETLESPLDCKEIKPVNLNGNQN